MAAAALLSILIAGACQPAPSVPLALPKASVPVAAPAPAAPVPCGGTQLAKPGGGSWRCTFEDGFAGPTLDSSKWVVQETAASGYHSGLECFVNRPGNVSVADGQLRLTVRKEAAPFTCGSSLAGYTSQYTSGMVSTFGKFSQAYGRFEVRAKVAAARVRGLHSALWLYPADPAYGAWPLSGEIDIAEMYSQYPDRAIPFVHYTLRAADPTVTNNYCYVTDVSQFHTYAIEWTPTQITVIYDGQTCLVHRLGGSAAPLVGSQPFDQPFMVVLTQALGIGTNAFDPATTPLPATTTIDYVRVWQ